MGISLEAFTYFAAAALSIHLASVGIPINILFAFWSFGRRRGGSSRQLQRLFNSSWNARVIAFFVTEVA